MAVTSPPAAYLDHAADTPVRPEALAAMLPWLGGAAGNPTGAHGAARAARRAVDDARDAVAALVGCRPGEVVFTSGGTEADDLAVHGLGDPDRHGVVCSAVEHAAVRRPVVALGGRTAGVGAGGVIDLDHLAAELDPGVRVVSVMAANNETGVRQPIGAVAEVVRTRAPGAVVHTDAVQAAPWLDLAEVVAAADAVSLSAHKLGGPGGVGALVVRHGTTLRPRLLGGGQERDRRAGSHAVAAILGFGAAAEALAADRAALTARTEVLARRLHAGLARVPGVHRTVPEGVPALPGIVHATVAGVAADELVFLLDEAGVAVAGGSSCASGALTPSPVLEAMGVPADVAALRCSLGWCSTTAEVDRAVAAVAEVVGRLRAVPDPPSTTVTATGPVRVPGATT